MRVSLGGPATPPGFDEAHREQTARYPCPPTGWQPVHTVYVPADVFDAGTVAAWGDAASALLERHLPTAAELAAVFEIAPHEVARAVWHRLGLKLAGDPVEDLRVDFEDGYGTRSDDEEDADTVKAAEAIAEMYRAETLPRRWGLRVKSFADGNPARSLRTLDGFLTTLAERVGVLPPGFTVTFPKVIMEAYIGQFAARLEALERALGLPARTLRFEIQVEAPQTVLFLQRSPDAVAAAGGRLAAAHFGVFDYTAACGLPPHEQRLDHPVCDHARHVMRTVFAGTGVELSDGSLAAGPASDDTADVHALWRRHAALVRHSLSHGFHQGWDMHPAHLVSRYAAVYAFHLARYDEYRERVHAWQEGRAAAGGVLDEPATIATLTAALRRADHALGNT
ncbi:aldolase [Thermopolyspora sp. NPDC052614]|uniref:DUF6986 family protein n=1 Tax=Thermopolyspora sp. NPDC052614 TaxID=3155682 RepID=UPI00344A82A6